jgi:large repetitive protein
VTIGGTAATNVVVMSGTQITATTPAHAAGPATVTVIVNGQAGSLTNGFNYNAAVAISFGQVAAATPQSPTTTVPVSFRGRRRR